MNKSKNQNIRYTWMQIIYMVMLMSLQTCRFKWIDPKEFHMNKYTYNGSEGCVLDLKYPKELRKLELIF